MKSQSLVTSGEQLKTFPHRASIKRLCLKADFIIARDGKLTPIEVKWTENPALTAARHLLTFLGEHPNQAKHGYLICRWRQPLRLHDKVTALPWFCS